MPCQKKDDNKGRILKTERDNEKTEDTIQIYRFIWRTAICLLVELGYRLNTAGKRDCISLERKSQSYIHDGIDVVGKNDTRQLYAKQNAQRPKVRKTLKLDANILWIF